MKISNAISLVFCMALIALTAGSCSTPQEKQSSFDNKKPPGKDLLPVSNKQPPVKNINPFLNRKTPTKRLSSVGDIKYSAKNWLKTRKHNQPAKSKKKEHSIESLFDPLDKKYIEDYCTDCHTLDRVFLMRGSASKWKKLLNKKHHQEMELENKEINRLLEIFAKYLSKY